MNTKLLLVAGLATGLALQLCPSALANTVTVSATPDVVIPDNNLNGVASTVAVSTPDPNIFDVSVTLNIVGAPTAYNGDYYAYLQFDSGFIVLLNNIENPPLAFGASGNGMSITLDDSGTPNIANAPNNSPLTGTYAPQGPGTFASAFDSLNPNGNWTLFIADESQGDVGELTSWSLSVTVPDHSSTLFMLGMGVVGLLGLGSVPRLRAAKISRR